MILRAVDQVRLSCAHQLLCFLRCVLMQGDVLKSMSFSPLQEEREESPSQDGAYIGSPMDVLE